MWSATSRLAANATRPVTGFFLPASDEIPALLLETWEVEGVEAYDGSWSTLGLALPNAGHNFEPPANGLLVGRLEPRAWFKDVAGEGHYLNNEQHICLDPGRIDISDHEVVLEEWEGEELANSRRLQLGDLALGARAGQNRFPLSLPTLGRGFAHEAHLYHRNGELLDRTQRSRLVEQMVVRGKMSLGDETARTEFTIGEKVAPSLNHRLDQLGVIEDAYRAMLSAGLEERIISDPVQARATIDNELGMARGELLVMDPYFGVDAADWVAVENVSIPIKVLSGQAAKPVPAHLAGLVKLRKWKAKKGAPPFHDRLYLWDDGGLSVGTSPSGLGKRDARIDRLRKSEADGWRAMFESYWKSADFIGG